MDVLSVQIAVRTNLVRANIAYEETGANVSSIRFMRRNWGKFPILLHWRFPRDKIYGTEK